MIKAIFYAISNKLQNWKKDFQDKEVEEANRTTTYREDTEEMCSKSQRNNEVER